MSLKLVLSLIVSAFLVRPTNGQSSHAIAPVPANTILNWLKAYHVPAVGVGIIENGRVKSVDVLGELDAGISAPKNTIWNVASLAKPVTALVALTLVRKGLWALDEPVANYFTDPDIVAHPWSKKLTTRLLLSHQSGFKNWPRLEPDNKLAFHFEPGKWYKYSGAGFEYLRKSLEAKFHKALPTLAAENLFMPAGMVDTRYSWSTAVDSVRFAEAHSDKGDIYGGRLKQPNAADWLLTTVGDYSRFAAYVINGAQLSETLYQQMITIQVHMDTLASHHNQGFGLGWEVIMGLSGDEFALTHNGADPGIASFVLLLPKSKRGIVIFTNGDGGRKIISSILKASKIDLASELSTYMGEFN